METIRDTIIEKMTLLIKNELLDFDEYQIIDKDSWIIKFKYLDNHFYLFHYGDKAVIGYNSLMEELNEDVNEFVDLIKNYIVDIDIKKLNDIII